MNGQKAVSIAQVGQVYFDEWVSITSAATHRDALRDVMHGRVRFGSSNREVGNAGVCQPPG